MSSDFSEKPIYSDAGVQWLPIDTDNSVGIGADDDFQTDVEKSIIDSESLLSDGGLDVEGADQPIFLQPLNRGRYLFEKTYKSLSKAIDLIKVISKYIQFIQQNLQTL